MAESVRLTIKLGGGLALTAGLSQTELVAEAPVALGEVACLMGLPPGAVMLHVVNGKIQGPAHVLADGDEVLLMPAVSGGWR